MKIQKPFLSMIVGAGAALVLISTPALGAEELKTVNVKFMMRGYCYAGSRVDGNAPGGFGPSDNMPKKMDSKKVSAPEGKLSLIALPGEAVPFLKDYHGFRFMLVNRTKSEVAFAASDSRLAIVQEAQDAQGKWQPIEYLPSSWCGNSYHCVFLPKDHYWEFTAPKHSGALKTKLRFVLQQGEGKVIYSNEFEGSVDPQQFTAKQGHKPAGIMDPYLD